MTFKHCTLFGMPVFEDEIHPERYNKKQLIKDIKYNYKISKQRGSGFGKWHDSYECTDKRFKKIQSDELVKIYIEKLKAFCVNHLNIKKDCAINIQIINYTCNKEDAFMTPHMHLGADFGLVHYLQVPKESSPIRFSNQNSFGKFFNFLRPDLYDLVDSDKYINSWMFEYFSINPLPDSILLFPAVMMHEVPFQKQVMKDERISIVANVKIEKV